LKRRIGMVLLLVILALVALFWLLPAAWALPLLQRRMPGVHLDAVGGSLWQGHAENVTDDKGRLLGRVDWTLSRRVVLGQLNFAFDFQGPAGSAGGELEGRGEVQAWRHVRLNLDISRLKLPAAMRMEGASGRLTGTFDTLTLRSNWPQDLTGTLRWRDAAVNSRGEEVKLGDLRADLAGMANVIHGELRNEGDGPVTLQGSLLVAPIGWRLAANLRPRRADAALERVLSRWAHKAADGSYPVNLHAGVVPAEAP
jgi:general secretion pathway protein N